MYKKGRLEKHIVNMQLVQEPVQEEPDHSIKTVPDTKLFSSQVRSTISQEETNSEGSSPNIQGSPPYKAVPAHKELMYSVSDAFGFKADYGAGINKAKTC